MPNLGGLFAEPIPPRGIWRISEDLRPFYLARRARLRREMRACAAIDDRATAPCRLGSTWSAGVMQPPQADERQHEGCEPVAAAEPGPHRGVRERARGEFTRGSPHPHQAAAGGIATHASR